MPYKRRNKKSIIPEPMILVPTAIRMGIVIDPTIHVKKEIIVGSSLNAIKSLKKENRNLPIL